MTHEKESTRGVLPPPPPPPPPPRPPPPYTILPPPPPPPPPHPSASSPSPALKSALRKQQPTTTTATAGPIAGLYLPSHWLPSRQQEDPEMDSVHSSTYSIGKNWEYLTDGGGSPYYHSPTSRKSLPLTWDDHISTPSITSTTSPPRPRPPPPPPRHGIIETSRRSYSLSLNESEWEDSLFFKKAEREFEDLSTFLLSKQQMLLATHQLPRPLLHHTDTINHTTDTIAASTAMREGIVPNDTMTSTTATTTTTIIVDPSDDNDDYAKILSSSQSSLSQLRQFIQQQAERALLLQHAEKTLYDDYLVRNNCHNIFSLLEEISTSFQDVVKRVHRIDQQNVQKLAIFRTTYLELGKDHLQLLMTFDNRYLVSEQ